jgi:hypothetical protein
MDIPVGQYLGEHTQAFADDASKDRLRDLVGPIQARAL